MKNKVLNYWFPLSVAIFSCVPLFAQNTPQSPFPPPTGPYSVGRTQFDWTDESRADASNPSGHREVVVWFWYPASLKSDVEPAEWMPGKWGEIFLSEYLLKRVVPANLAEVTEVLKEHPLNTIRTHAFTDAPVTNDKKKFPVLLFEPGLGETPLSYAVLIEDLASHGYIVAGVVPTHYTYVTVFSDGRVLDTQNDHSLFPPGSEKRTSENQGQISVNGHTAYLSREQVNEFNVRSFRDWTQDMLFVLNQLEKLDATAHSPFHKRLDLTRIGAFGHSFGGAASLEVAKEDARVRAAIDLDGSLAGDLREGGLFKPLLFMKHRLPDRSDDSDAALLRDGKPAYRLCFSDSAHHFSADLGLLPFLPQSMKKGLTGAVAPARALLITKAYVEAFFDEYLRGKPSPLLNGPSPDYPEINFETNKAK